MPYAVDNVYDVYRSHRTITSVLDRPLFRELRAWQLQYAGRADGRPAGNMFTPCPIRDHHEVGREVLVRLGARPMHEDAALALADPEYAERMIDYGRKVSALLDPVWEREVLGREAAATAARGAPSRADEPVTA